MKSLIAFGLVGLLITTSYLSTIFSFELSSVYQAGPTPNNITPDTAPPEFVGSEGEGNPVLPTETPLPTPIPTSTPPPFPQDRCAIRAAAYGTALHIRTSPLVNDASESSVLEPEQIAYPQARYIVSDGDDDSNNESWFLTENGWIAERYNGLVTQSNDLCEQLPEISYPLIAENCPVNIRNNAQGLGLHIQIAYGQDCEALRSITNDVFSTHNYVPAGDFQDCPWERPGFTEFLERFDQESNLTIIEVLAELRLTGSTCQVAETINRGEGLPPGFPAQAWPEALPLACNPSITDNRYTNVISQLEALGLSDSTLQTLLPDAQCQVAGSTNRLGTLNEAQQSLYDYFATTCELAPQEALSHLEQVIRAGVNSAQLLDGISTAACTDLESTLEPYLNTLELESTWEEALSTCQELAYLLRNHYPNSLTDTQLQRLLTSDQPCAAVQMYLDSGRIRNNLSGSSNNPFPQPQTQPPVSPSATAEATAEIPPSVTPTPGIPGIGTFLAREGNSEDHRIYTFRDENRIPVNTLEDSPLNKLFPVYRPDNTSSGQAIIAYIAEEASGNYALYITEENEGSYMQLCDTFNGLKVAPFPPAWTADSQHLMFTVEDENGNHAIYSLNELTHCQEQEPRLIIREGHSPALPPQFSENADSSYPLIAFVKNNQILVHITTNNFPVEGYEQLITTPTDGICSEAAFNTESANLYYVCEVNGEKKIYIYDIAGDEREVLPNFSELETILNFAPGPVDGYFAFDNGEDIFFGSEIDAELGVLSIPGLSLSHLSWHPHSEN